MAEINPLLFYMQAADYPDILEELDKIPCDKFIVKYMPYPWPHNLARDFFLEHEEYTHLIVHPQDLLVKKEHYDALLADIKKYDYPVLSGVCNVERMGHAWANMWAICKICPSKFRNERRYFWVPACKDNIGIMEVEFQGMVFCWIKRDVIERVNLEGEYIFQGTIHTDGRPAPDLNFCINCKKAGIPIHADTDVRMFHYANHKPSLVNIKPAEKLFIRNGISVLA